MFAENKGYPFHGCVLNIAYSDLLFAPMNSAEHYQLAAHLGFDALKGDVRITADGGLVMCHDEGITLDENGRIGRYDRNDQMKFRDLSYASLMEMEYASFADAMGHYARMCDFETFVRICKKNRKMVYATVRDYNIPQMIEGVIAVLRKYDMEEHCIINSFTYESLCEVRRHSQKITVSQVQDLGYLPNTEDVDRLCALGNSIMTLFWYTVGLTRERWAEADEVMAYAKTRSLPVHMALVPSRAQYEDMIEKGICGFQLYRAVLPYTRSDVHFDVAAENGEATFVNILRGDTYTATVSMESGIVSVRDIAYNGSPSAYPDGLPALWLNTLDHRLEVTCAENPQAAIRWDGKALLLDTQNVNGVYRIHVSV